MAAVPIITKTKPSRYSIVETLSDKQQSDTSPEPIPKTKLPANHFSETDLAEEWNTFLSGLKHKDIVKYSAINCFTLKKVSENTVEVRYPSEASKLEFDKISTDFLNHFRHKVHNFKISFSYKMDMAVKREVMTKRKKFEQLAAINPLLYELNELLNFDLS